MGNGRDPRRVERRQGKESTIQLAKSPIIDKGTPDLGGCKRLDRLLGVRLAGADDPDLNAENPRVHRKR
jgi:hypothetical protein